MTLEVPVVLDVPANLEELLGLEIFAKPVHSFADGYLIGDPHLHTD